MISDLTEDQIEEGRSHPFVQALIRELARRHLDMLNVLEDRCAMANAEGSIYAAGGRAAELRAVIALITTAKGRPE